MPKPTTKMSLSIDSETSRTEESSQVAPETYAQLPPLPPSPLNTESTEFPELQSSMSFYALD
jgi:hypothetical protein